ncbi:MAG: S-layer homology domain-containing protein [Oscillospiraceae bacterium]|nr:S-layer homology domain-containing protein [Oscillospiraceae bacterium]
MKRFLCTCLAVLMLVGIVAPAAMATVGSASGFTTEPVIAAGARHSAAIRNDGTVWTWGNNENGQLGDGTRNIRNRPVQVLGLSNMIDVAVGDGFTIALRDDGTIWSWGTNWVGQLGDGTLIDRMVPVRVQQVVNVVAISAGWEFATALQADGTVWAWGHNLSGQLGNNTSGNHTTWPVRVHNLDGVTAISSGGVHAMALRNNGTLWAWGNNWYGQLGDGTIENHRLTPVQVQGLTNVTAVSAGGWHTAAIQNGGLWTWGVNTDAQLGNGTMGSHTNSGTPAQVQNLSNVTAVAAGAMHTVAQAGDAFWAWGNNWFGQLGNGGGNQDVRTAPVRVDMQNLNSAMALVAGDVHTVAIRGDGTVWSWGGNAYGQLGDGSTTHRSVPGRVLGQDNLIFRLAPPGSTPFHDVSSSNWFYDAVVFVFEAGIKEGTSDTTFEPRTNLSRAMVATILWRMAGEPDATYRPVFHDVAAGRWYSEAIIWAYDAGVVEGTGPGRFRPTDDITREQFATMMARYATYTRMNMEVPSDFDLARFTDTGEISDWAEEGMLWSVYVGLIIGVDDDATSTTALLPRGTTTRAESATIIMRYMQTFADVDTDTDVDADGDTDTDVDKEPEPDEDTDIEPDGDTDAE